MEICVFLALAYHAIGEKGGGVKDSHDRRVSIELPDRCEKESMRKPPS
jgi:hypothetical protein